MMRRRMAVASPESGVRELRPIAKGTAPWTFRHAALISWIIGFCLFLLACGKSGGGGGEGLLAGRLPSRSEGVAFAERITDGVVPRQGTAWNNDRAARLASRSAFVEYDLGAEQRIAAAAILADNNDQYEITASSDGKTFKTVWVAPSVSGSGLRWRHTNALDTSARYVRLQSTRGDASLSVAELVLYSDGTVSLPPSLREVSALPSDLALRNALLVFATAVAVALALAWQGATWLWLGVLVGGVVAASAPLAQAFSAAWPVEQLEVSLTRGVMAALAAAAIAREAFGPGKYPAHRKISVSVLSLAALASVMAFYNLGRPQFYDHKLDEPSYVHNFDMRVYFPVAKYFKELRYDGLYLASVATYAEEHGGVDNRSIQKVELRDLRDHRMRRVEEVRDEVVAIKQRFSPERWEELKADMRYFWETMGARAYLGSMRDHGGNATPFWLAIAHLMFAKAKASNEVLLLGALLDPLMLVALFVAIWRSFGVRTALVSMVVFGANDFYMFGSNWGGATLRHDWMAYLGFGVCALKTRRWVLGGALLGLSALIRAFPAIALLALAVPLGWWLYEEHRKRGTLPSLTEAVREHRWLVQTAAGALGCAAVVFLFSSMVLGFDAWILWVKKIASFTSDPHVNHVSLLTVTSGSEGNQALVRAHRMPFHLAATALYLVLAVWAARRAAPHRVALLGMMMMPVLMYPANYYIHFIFVLPMLVDEHPPGTTLERIDPTTAKVWLLLLGLCAAQYFTVKEKDLAIHFYNASVLLMAAILGILIVLVQRLLADEAVGQTVVDASGVLLTTGAPAAVAEIAPTEDTRAEAEARAETPEEEASSKAAAEVATTARDEEGAVSKK